MWSGGFNINLREAVVSDFVSIGTSNKVSTRTFSIHEGFGEYEKELEMINRRLMEREIRGSQRAEREKYNSTHPCT